MANLAYGSSGSDVRALQEALRKAGYNIAADGVFGAETQNAVRQYQSAQGLSVDGIAGQQTFGSLGIGSGGNTSSGGGSTSYSGSSYNNGGLTTQQVAEMQKYYGTNPDGLWGQNSTAAAGGMNAQQAWAQYQQQKGQDTTQGVMGFEDFYNGMGGASYEQMVRDSINASVQQAVNAFEAQKADTERDAAEMARQAYIAKMLGQKNLGQQLAAGGYAGGMAESAMLESETTYQNNLAEIERQKQRTLEELQRAIDNARLTGDMEAAEMLAAFMQTVQGDYSDYYTQQQEAQAAASAVTPVTPVTPVAPVTPTESWAVTEAKRNGGNSVESQLRYLENMKFRGQITESQLNQFAAELVGNR